jgi:AI-2 transport protein TqsA
MSTRVEIPGLIRFLIIVAAMVVIVAGMRAATTILVPFLLATFITVITTPFFIGLQRKGVPSVVALLILILILFVFGFLLVGLIGKSLNDFTTNLPTYQKRLDEQLGTLRAWFDSKGIDLPDYLSSSEAGEQQNATGVTRDESAPAAAAEADQPTSGDRISGILKSGSVMRFFGNMVNAFSSLLSKFFLILIIVIFMLFEAAILPKKVRSLPGLTDETWKKLNEAVDNVRHYMALKTIISLLTGLLVFIFLVVMDIDFALLLGLLAFVLNFVPNIGSFIAGIPGVLMAFIQYGAGTSIVVAIGYVAINTLVGNAIEPRVMGRGLGLSPLVVMISLIFWGWVLGPVGMLLSIPLTIAVKISLESVEETRWIAVLMGSTPSLKPKKVGQKG